MFVSRKMFWGRIKELVSRMNRSEEEFYSRCIGFNDRLNEKLYRDEVITCADCGCLVHVNAANEVEPEVKRLAVYRELGDPRGTSPGTRYEVQSRYICKRCLSESAPARFPS